MLNLVFILLCLVIGALLKRFSVLPANAPNVLNNLILYVCLPATSLIYASNIAFDRRYVLVIAMPWLLYGGSALFFHLLDKYIRFHKHTKAVLIMTAGIPSISFVALPIFQMLYGEEGAKIGILMSQAGSFLACNTLGVITASVYASENPKFAVIAKDVLTFPTFIAFTLAMIMNGLDAEFSASMLEILKKLSAPFTFIALIAVGLQMEFNVKSLQKHSLKWGFLYKLVICPVVVFLLYCVGFEQDNLMAKTSVMGAAVGSMNMTAAVAMRYNLNPTLAAQMVGVGIPLSLISVSLIYFLL
jgi:hypothetical protein